MSAIAGRAAALAGGPADDSSPALSRRHAHVTLALKGWRDDDSSRPWAPPSTPTHSCATHVPTHLWITPHALVLCVLFPKVPHLRVTFGNGYWMRTQIPVTSL